jgi:hypothetical protein
MDEAGITNVSATIDIEALRAYRLAVGHRTREIVKSLQPEDLKKKVKNELRILTSLPRGVATTIGGSDYSPGRSLSTRCPIR